MRAAGRIFMFPSSSLGAPAEVDDNVSRSRLTNVIQIEPDATSFGSETHRTNSAWNPLRRILCVDLRRRLRRFPARVGCTDCGVPETSALSKYVTLQLLTPHGFTAPAPHPSIGDHFGRGKGEIDSVDLYLIYGVYHWAITTSQFRPDERLFLKHEKYTALATFSGFVMVSLILHQVF